MVYLKILRNQFVYYAFNRPSFDRHVTLSERHRVKMGLFDGRQSLGSYLPFNSERPVFLSTIIPTTSYSLRRIGYDWRGQCELYLTVCYWKSQMGVRKRSSRNRPTFIVLLDTHNIIVITEANPIISKINKMWTDVNNIMYRNKV